MINISTHKNKLFTGLAVIFALIASTQHWIVLSQPLHLNLHLILELTAIVISFMIVLISWNSLNPSLKNLQDSEKDINLSRILLFGFLFIALMDLSHIVSFNGTSTGTPESRIDSMQEILTYWLLGRIAEFITALCLVFGVSFEWSRLKTILTSILLSSIVIGAIEFNNDYLPTFFDSVSGVTNLKTNLEVLLSVCNFVLAYFVLTRKFKNSHLSSERIILLGYASIFIGAGEAALSYYPDIASINTVVGHLYKIFAYFFIYQATFVASFYRPYLKLYLASEENRKNELELQNLLQALPITIAKLDSNLRYRYVNQDHEEKTGVPLEETIGRHIDEIIPHAIRDVVRPHLQSALTGKGGSFNYTIERNDGSIGHRHVILVPDKSYGDEDYGVLSLVIDITENKMLHKKMQTFSRELNELNSAVDAHAIVAYTDKYGIITKVNDKFCELSKYSRNELIGSTHRIINSGFHDKEFFSNLWETISSGKVWSGEICNKAKDGSLYWVQTTIFPSIDNETNKPSEYIAIRADITERKLMENKAHYLALHDVLTGLANRRLMHEQLVRTLERSKQTSSCGSLLLLDLDNFKNINDTLGHKAGDTLLIEFANRLKSCVRETDVVGRLGGDEFVIILIESGKSVDEAKINTSRICNNIFKSLREPISLAPEIEAIKTSIGFVTFNGSEKSIDVLFEQADNALYEAKKSGKNTFACV